MAVVPPAAHTILPLTFSSLLLCRTLLTLRHRSLLILRIAINSSWHKAPSPAIIRLRCRVSRAMRAKRHRLLRLAPACRLLSSAALSASSQTHHAACASLHRSI